MTLGLTLATLYPIEAQTLKDAYKDHFLVGVAVAQPIITRNQTASINLICEQFNAVSPESVLKPEYIHPAPDRWNFEPGDAYCKFAADHGLKALGHTLMWHNQTPDFFWLNPDGSVRTDEEMRQTLVEYIEKTVTHFKGKVYAWDVVNEIVSEDHNRSDEGNGFYRKDKGWEKYYRGDKDDLVALAFQTAQRCDPDAELYYNDYNMWRQSKVDGVVHIVKMLKERGIRIDGVGIQAHWGLNYPDMKDVERTIDRLYELGVKVMITELDIDMLPLSKEGQMTGKALQDHALQRAEFMRWLNPYKDGLPAEVEQQLADRWEEVMRTLYNRRDKLSRVTFWGLHDGISWKNDYPIPNRRNYPLLFNRDLSQKSAFQRVVDIPKTDIVWKKENAKNGATLSMLSPSTLPTDESSSPQKVKTSTSPTAEPATATPIIDLGTNNGYYDLTDKVGATIKGLRDFSISVYYKVGKDNPLDGYGHFLFAFSKLAENKADEGPYMAMRLNEQRFETSTGGYEHEEIIMQGGKPKRDVWVHAIYRQKGKTGELYLDGKLIGRNANMPILADIFDQAPANCWIGRAPFRGDKYLTHTQVADFRIYNYAVSDKEMKQLSKDKSKLK